MALGLPEGHRNVIVSTYLENRTNIRQLLQEFSLRPNQYHDLEWRLQVKVSVCELHSHRDSCLHALRATMTRAIKGFVDVPIDFDILIVSKSMGVR